MLNAVRRFRHPSPAVLLTGVMTALMVFSLVAVSRPSTALASTSIMQAVCSASLRTSASTSATIRTTIKAGTRVTVVARVIGGAWRSTCGTRTGSSTWWYRISAINGRSVMSLYGRSYLYAVPIRFKTISTTTTTTSTSGRYGPGIGADSLANTQIGGTLCKCANSQTSYRFQATTSAALSSIRIYLVDGSGYSGGTGGTLSISVQTDDGTTAHRPSGRVLAATSIRPGNPISIGYLPLITFSSPASLTAGTLYHIVFRNSDPSPTVNYVSVDSLWTTSSTTPRQPGLSDVAWAQLMNTGTGWTTRSAFTPILDLGYSNGVHGGMGYMEVWIRAARSIGGSSAVREIFTPTVGRTVSAVSVRVKRVSGSSPLTVRLIETSTGAVLASGTIAAGSVGTGQTWVGATLSSAVSLKAGVAYQVRLTTPSDTVYSTFGIERGNNYHFSASTYFHDGYGQYTTGSGWTGFDQPGGSTNNTNADVQFLLR